MESLSFHDIACLCVGMKPTIQKGRKFSPPLVPEEFLSDVEQSDIDMEYRKIAQLLLRAATEKVIDLSKAGRVAPKVAIAYLEQVAKSQNADWVDQCEFASVVRSLQPKSKEVEDMKLKVLELECELARYRARATYTTPMLDLAYKVIDEFYAGKTDWPKFDNVEFFLLNKLINGKKISGAKIRAIWAVASHPSQESGGPRSAKKRAKS